MSKKRSPKPNARALVTHVQKRIDGMRVPVAAPSNVQARIDSMRGGPRAPAAPSTDPIMRRIEQLRSDDWKNLLTGYGTGRDKRTSNFANAELLTPAECEEIWRASATADRVVSTEPEEMFREGFTLHIQDEDEQSAEEFSFQSKAKTQELAIQAEAAKNGAGPGAPPFGKGGGKDGEGKGGKPFGKGGPPQFGKKDAYEDLFAYTDSDGVVRVARFDALPDEDKKKIKEKQQQGQPAVGALEQEQPKEGDRQKEQNAPAGEEKPNESEGKPGEEGDRQNEGEAGAANAQQNSEVELGYEEELQPKKEKESEGDDLSDSMTAYAEELGVVAKMQEAEQFRRAYGGAALFLGVDDGQDPIEPLNDKAIKSFTWINVLMPLEIQPATWYEDASAPKYGEPKTYRITQIGGNNQAMKDVHESRIIRLVGAQVSRLRTRELNGWGDSVFVRTKKAIADFDVSYGAAAVLLSEFSQTIISFKGLAEWVATNGTEMLKARIEAIDLARSVLKATVVDADGETVERKATTVTGMPELLDRMGNKLSAESRIPVTFLMGQAPAGLNATGESDVRTFFARIKAMQTKHAKPVLERILKLMFLNKGGPAKGNEPENWQVKFPPLWAQTQKEIVEARKLQAEVDEKYIANEVLMPEEVARARFGGADYSFDTKVDFDLRKKLSADAPAVGPDGEPLDPLDPKAKGKLGPDGKPLPPGKQPATKLGPDGKPLPIKPGAGKELQAKDPEGDDDIAFDDTPDDEEQDKPRKDYDPSQPRDEQGQFGEGGSGGNNVTPAIHPTSKLGPDLKSATLKELHSGILEYFKGTGNTQSGDKEYQRIAKELKRRKIGSLTTLERKISKGEK